MQFLVIGQGRWGKVVANEFVTTMNRFYQNSHSIYITDKDKKKLSPISGCCVLPSHTAKLQYFDGIYLAVSQKDQFSILSQIPQHIPVILEKPAIGNPLDMYIAFNSLDKDRIDNTAVGHIYLMSRGFRGLQIKIQKTNVAYISGKRFNVDGPIRRDIDCFWDLGIHDTYLFYDLIKYLSDKDLCVRDIHCNLRYRSQYGCCFEYGWRDIHGVFECGWINEKKIREWRIVNNGMVWQPDTINIKPSNMQLQLYEFINWCKSGLKSNSLHYLKDARICSEMMGRCIDAHES